MIKWYVATGLAMILAGCGGTAGDSSRPPAVKTMALIGEPQPALKCGTLQDPGQSPYEVTAFKSKGGAYDHLVLKRAGRAPAEEPAVLADFTHYLDETPPPPTDIRFRWLFSDESPSAGGDVVMLQEGGFTDAATAEVRRAGETPTSLTCKG